MKNMPATRRSTRLQGNAVTSKDNISKQTDNSIWSHRNCPNKQSEEEEHSPKANLNLIENVKTIVKLEEQQSLIETPKSTRKRNLPITQSKKPESIKHVQPTEGDYNEVSPPKQRKSEGTPKEQITPSRLINRLNIKSDTESDEESEDVVSKEEFNKYQNARRILSSGEVIQLPGREKQLEELRDYFLKHFEEKRSGSLYISGQPGTGKTACLSLLINSEEYQKRFKSIYINCTSITTIGSIYKKLCNELKLKPASGTTERDYTKHLENYFKRSKKMILMVLDEIDQLCTSKQTVLYTIFEWPSLPNAQLLLVGIANNLDLTERLLLRLSGRSEFKPKHMHFPPYTKQEIIEIFKKRLEMANVMEIFPPATLQLLAAKVSAVSGDVRRALDIGRRVVEIAEQQLLNVKELKIEKTKATETLENNDNKNDDDNDNNDNDDKIQPVQITQVATVINNVYGTAQNLQDDIEESFPLQQKLTLCSLMLMLSKERNKNITLGRLHEVYRRVCNRRNIQPLDQTEFCGLLDLIETRGILKMLKKKEVRLSKVQLLWDEQEINNALKDKQLIASILHDVACLEK